MSRAAPTFSVYLIAALCAFVFYGPARSFSNETQSIPRMVLKKQIHDFRNVLEGEVLEQTFEVLNQGSEPLRIEQVRPSCACTVVDFDPLVLPKEEGKIKVKIDTRGFDSQERWEVKVFTNDPKWKVAVLDLRANIQPVINVKGAPVFFGGRKNTAMTREVDISSGLNKPLILTPEAFTLSGQVTYSLSEIEKKKRYRLFFQDTAKKRENYRGYLKLKTSFTEKPEITIWIIGWFEN